MMYKMVVIGAVFSCAIGASFFYYHSQQNNKQSMAQDNIDASDSAPTQVNSVINWNAPSEHDLVERALSDGMTDPAQIVAWARNYKVVMTIDKVLQLKTELEKRK